MCDSSTHFDAAIHSLCLPARIDESSPSQCLAPKAEPAHRAACDRCRGQKLRCPRTKPGSQVVCDRCQRSGALCKTTPRLPLGRPSLRDRGGAQHRPDAKRIRCKVRRDVNEPRQPISGLLPSPPTTASSRRSSPVDSPAISPEQAVLFTNPDSPPPFSIGPGSLLGTQNLIDDSFDPVLCFDFDCSTSVSGDSGDATDCSDRSYGCLLGNMPDFPLCDRLETGDTSSQANCTPLDEDPRTDERSGHVQGVGSSMEFIERISRISNRIVDLQRTPWELWNPLSGPGALPGNDPTELIAEWHSPGGQDPFQNALMTTTELLVLLQSFAAPSSSGGRQVTGLTDLSTTLMLLSTYIQIGQLFETLLASLRQCCQGLNLGVQTLRTQAAQTQVSNASSQHRLFLMVQMLDGYSSSMERLIGLPTERRHLGSADDGAAILGPSCTSSMVVMTMKSQVHETFGSLGRDMQKLRVDILGLNAPW